MEDLPSAATAAPFRGTLLRKAGEEEEGEAETEAEEEEEDEEEEVDEVEEEGEGECEGLRPGFRLSGLAGCVVWSEAAPGTKTLSERA